MGAAQVRSLVNCLFFLFGLAVQPATAADAIAVGQEVMPKLSLIGPIDEELTSSRADFPWKVTKVDGDEIWCDELRLKTEDVITAANAISYYFDVCEADDVSAAQKSVICYWASCLRFVQKDFVQQTESLSQAIDWATAAGVVESSIRSMRKCRALAEHRSGKPELAVVDWHYVLTVSVDADSLHEYGHSLRDLGLKAGTVEALTKAAEIEPGVDRHYLCLAMSWQDYFGEDQKAIAAYSKALEINPTAWVFARRGRSYYFVGKYEEAIADLNKALQLDGDDQTALVEKARMLATCPDASYRDGATAVKLARRAQAVSTDDDLLVWYALAESHAEVGDFEKAIHWQERVVKATSKPYDEEILKMYQSSEPRRYFLTHPIAISLEEPSTHFLPTESFKTSWNQGEIPGLTEYLDRSP